MFSEISDISPKPTAESETSSKSIDMSRNAVPAGETDSVVVSNVSSEIRGKRYKDASWKKIKSYVTILKK